MSQKFLSKDEIERLTRARFPDFGDGPIDMDVIDRDGSGRCFYRLKNRREAPVSIMAMNYTLDRAENGKFVEITRFLQTVGVKVPSIRAELLDPNVLWVDDLGSKHLIDFWEDGWDRLSVLYQHTLMAVGALHEISEAQKPADLPNLEGGFDEALYTWEQDYFFENFVANFCKDLDGETVGKIRHGRKLQEIRESLASAPRALVHRDFQSTNVMVREGRTWMIDYQGMRWGVPEYDVASLIYDPYVPLTKAHRDELAAYYFEVRAHTKSPIEIAFSDYESRLNRAAAQRLMQALGAYGNLGLNIGKTEFLKHIPVGIERLREAAVERGAAPELEVILDAVKL